MEQFATFNATKAVEINRDALVRIIAELFAMLGVVSGRAIERLLRPAESAVRRLIIMAARGLVVKVLPKLPMLKGKKIERKSAGRMSFRLFDRRKKFDFIKPANPLIVYVKTYSSNPFNLFDKMYMPPPAKPAASENTMHLNRRLTAMAYALENLSGQARRLARWKARRKLLEKPKFTSPLRPGLPLGYRRKPKAEVDYVLQECHYFATEALREDSS
jgi:hypothetical protein